MKNFNFNEAFNRNIGFLSEWDQQILRHKRVAIAGLGGVGGVHLTTLLRLGVQNFHVADCDRFELANFNRQYGASMPTLDRSKTEVMAAIARDINPQAEINIFPEGINEGNLDRFLDKVDIFIDGLDAFLPDLRQLVFARCHQKNIPAITAAPVGMGTCYLVFMPGGMSFEEYFAMGNLPFKNKMIRFMFGLSPHLLHTKYPSRISLDQKKASSTMMGCQLASGVSIVTALKILLGRGKVLAAPYYHCFDPYLNTYIRKKLSGGTNNPLIRARIFLAEKIMRPAQQWKDQPAPDEASLARRILQLARWTPSGDNSQPWDFILSENNAARIHFHQEGSIYDFDGIPSTQTIGMFLETVRIAATGQGCTVEEHLPAAGDPSREIAVHFHPEAGIPEDPLLDCIPIRTVNRFPYKCMPLLAQQKNILESLIAPELKVVWLESPEMKKRMSRLSALSTHIRMNIPETFNTHKKIIDIHNAFSANKIPIKALGVSSITAAMINWALQSQERTRLLNRIFGTAVAEMELDLWPGQNSAGFFILDYNKIIHKDDLHSLINAGRKIQRFWLTLTAMGLSMQPLIAPLAFSYYSKHNIVFTKHKDWITKAARLRENLEELCPIDRIAFIGRIGQPRTTEIHARSIRKNFEELVRSPNA